MKIDGSCHCGRIAYEADVDPEAVGICHCSDCQALTGSAFRVTVTVVAADFHIVHGEPREYVKTAESGARRVQGFCPDCGSPLYATDAEERAIYGIRVGTVRQREDLVPTRQTWRRSALSWVPSMSHLSTWSCEQQ